ncbi:hypothetical protein VFPFJ_04506 [Purpureocillium lilacinum]|uniref:Uncharacterized protein n=1 Tax=Purpureocillium lilacinum TaxID=33203 RepID=A0A179HJB9_PURLI|nr:hypothetical protein VFPFJ_04506 [Purpureocillium lilacinum]OAQ90347.1 hypothetical protein VFPFJ_04506 [Purpureocillium lilacinum]
MVGVGDARYQLLYGRLQWLPLERLEVFLEVGRVARCGRGHRGQAWRFLRLRVCLSAATWRPCSRGEGSKKGQKFVPTVACAESGGGAEFRSCGSVWSSGSYASNCNHLGADMLALAR